jgi:glycogen debranching enzyme
MAQSADDSRAELRVVRPAEAQSGSVLELSSAQDSEQLVCARGSLFLVTERHGDVAPKGARELGLFYQDTRYVSYLALRIAKVQLVYLSSETSDDAFNQVDLMVTGLDEGEFLDDPQNFLHVRRRQMLDGGLVEQLTLTNFLNRVVELEIVLEFDADFADIFEVRGAKRVRRGERQPAQLSEAGVTLSYGGLDGVRYATEFAFSPPPTALEPGRASYTLSLDAGGKKQVEVRATPQRNGAHTGWARIPFAQRVDRLQDEIRAFRATSTRVRSDNAELERVFDRSVRDLYALQVQVGSNRMVAAGIPWFCCPFGRDSLISSYEGLLLNPELASGSLRVLADFQGKQEAEVSEEEEGKIFHELRFGEMANTREMPHSPYYGTIDATPLFVVLLDATYRVDGDLDLVRALRGPLLAALGWIDRRSANASAFVTYARKSPRGLDNQGWKDSRAGVSFPDGRSAVPPIALCEVQGYCVDAYRRGARLLAALGERELARLYTTRAEQLQARFEEHFWLPEQGRYAYAIDGEGRALPTVVSNLGHLLWSRVARPDRAASIAALLMSPASFSGFGVRTLATGQPVYNPLSYHNGTVWPHDNALIAKGMANYGETRRAAEIFGGLIAASSHFRDRRLPELFCGMPLTEGNLVRYPVACSPQAWASAAPYLLLQAALGLHIDAPARRIAIRRACLPAELDWVELEGLRVGATHVTMRLRRSGERVHVERLDTSGPTLRTDVEME